MKKEILIYEKDKDVLKSFFKEKKEYSAHFVRKDRNTLRIACTPDGKIKNYDDLINVADNALFRAKEKGRDRIAV